MVTLYPWFRTYQEDHRAEAIRRHLGEVVGGRALARAGGTSCTLHQLGTWEVMIGRGALAGHTQWHSPASRTCGRRA